MIRLIVGTLLFAFFSLVLQGVVLHAALPAYMIPNFVLVLVVFIGFYEVSVLGVVLAFLCGILFDLFSGTLIGPWSGSFVFIYVLLALFAQRLFTHSKSTVIISVFIANIISTTLYFALLYQFQPLRGSLFSVSVIESLSSAVVAPFVFMLLNRILIAKAPSRSSRYGISDIFSMARSER